MECSQFSKVTELLAFLSFLNSRKPLFLISIVYLKMGTATQTAVNCDFVVVGK